MLFLQRTTSQMTEPDLLAVKNEIEGLKSQISKTLTHSKSRSAVGSEDMDEMADYFGKRLEECQKQVSGRASVSNRFSDSDPSSDGGKL